MISPRNQRSRYEAYSVLLFSGTGKIITGLSLLEDNKVQIVGIKDGLADINIAVLILKPRC